MVWLGLHAKETCFSLFFVLGWNLILGVFCIAVAFSLDDWAHFFHTEDQQGASGLIWCRYSAMGSSNNMSEVYHQTTLLALSEEGVCLFWTRWCLCISSSNWWRVSSSLLHCEIPPSCYQRAGTVLGQVFSLVPYMMQANANAVEHHLKTFLAKATSSVTLGHILKVSRLRCNH